MAEKMPSQQQFRDRDYVVGRVKLPPAVAALPSQFFIYANDSDNVLGVQVADGASVVIPIQVDDSAYFLVEAIQVISSLKTILQDLATVQVVDTTTSRPWSDLAVPIRDFGGKGDNVKYLADPQILRPTGTLSVQITNNTGSAAAFYVAFIGRKIYGVSEDQANLLMRRSFFQYVANFPTGLIASATGSESASNVKVKVINDSDFIVKKLLSSELIKYVMALTGGALSDEVMISLRDTNGDRNYSDNPLPARLVLGGLAAPASTLANTWGNGAAFCLPKPMMIRRNSILQLKLSNKSTTAITAAFNVVLEGVKVYDQA